VVNGLPLGREALESNGLYDLLRAAGHAPPIADEVIGARAASSTEARLLGEMRNAPLPTMTRTAWDASGAPSSTAPICTGRVVARSS
jgi:DNA-binding GntR family transcriptional regulator